MTDHQPAGGEAGARAWIEVTDDPATWPTDADTDVIVQRANGDERVVERWSGGYARHWIKEDRERYAGNNMTQIVWWLRIPRIGERWPAPSAQAAEVAGLKQLCRELADTLTKAWDGCCVACGSDGSIYDHYEDCALAPLLARLRAAGGP